VIPEYPEILAFRQSLTPESDRGCAMIAVAYLDGQLEGLLRTNFVNDPKCCDDLLGPSRPLGTFAARVELAFALGLLPAETRHDLHLIRKIRNDFGHKPEPIAFSTAAISSRCSELSCTWLEKSEEPRDRFTNSVMSALSFIHAAHNRSVMPVVREKKPFESKKERAEFEAAWAAVVARLQSSDETFCSKETMTIRIHELYLEEWRRQHPAEESRS
jgi:DNA-binding MltR family transcriptional regulator